MTHGTAKQGFDKMSKRVLVVALVGVNLLLLACLILTTYSPPQAIAQEVAQGGRDYLLLFLQAKSISEKF